ncbi:MAG: sulfotransferase domain-containing protein [Pseudomonadota bacterium]
MPKKNLVWLASFPKSGNTWTRVFLANYLLNRETPMPINEVHRLGMGDSVPAAYAKISAPVPFDPTSLEQSLALRPRMLAAIAANGADVNFVKTHNANERAFGQALVPKAMTKSAVYIVRHPLDVACSYARHYGMTVEKAVKAMNRPDNIILGDPGNVPQYLGSWAGHVRSWTRHRDFPVLLLRYEDMIEDPETAFGRLLTHIGVPPDAERLTRAIGFSSFDEVARQEREGGFVEKSQHGDRFFHSGGSGKWRDQVPDAVAAQFAEANAKAMKARGYTL